MPRQRLAKHRVEKVNIRRVVKWRERHSYVPYIILGGLIVIGVLVVLFEDYLR
jgi:hypothetical protein